MPCTANWLLKMFKTQPRYLGKRCLPNIACCSSLASVKSRIFLLAPSDAIPCTLLTNSPQESCPLYPRKRTCAVQEAMSAMGQKQTCAAHGSCPPRAKGGSHFKVCWAGKLVIGDHVTGFLIIAAVGAASGLIQISSARPSRPLCAQRRI